MKNKNYQPAIHNFAHSFMSIDCTKSQRLAVDVLVHLNNLNLRPKAVFDFVGNTMHPAEAFTPSSAELMKDYSSWLPTHFRNHQCDLAKLVQLEITLWTELTNMNCPNEMANAVEIEIRSSTKWQVEGKEVKKIDISQTTVVSKDFIKTGFAGELEK